MSYRLALDLGSTSLGWCLLETKDKSPIRIVDMGVRIFPDGRDDKSKEPLAVSRRNARGTRRNLDRRDMRQKALMKYLVKFGLMPSDKIERKALENLDPYELRAKAANERIPSHSLGRALFHLNQRRGFKSNRKTDSRENESSNMKNAIKDMEAVLGKQTLGQYLWQQKQKSEPVRVRTTMVKNKAEYNFYPSRKMYEDEFDAIQKAQGSILTPEQWEKLKEIIFWQRPLKTPEVGNCRFEDKEKRARLAYPIVQKFRILQEVNNLEIERLSGEEPRLTPKHKKEIINSLLTSHKKTFNQIKTLLKNDFGRDIRFNLESEKRNELKGDDTGFILSADDYFGAEWYDFSQAKQEEIIDLIFDTQDPELLIEKLMQKYDLSSFKAENVANAKLVEGYGNLSKKAIEKMMPFLEQGMIYPHAAKAAGYHHSDFRTGEVFEKLPYYGEVLHNNVIGGSYASQDKDLPEKYFGKINNPTVHIALNQVRKLVNALIDVYGHPDEIVIEMARDLKAGQEELTDINKEQTANTKHNNTINKKLATMGVKQNYRNRMLFKLWEDLAPSEKDRLCPFCTNPHPISLTDIFIENKCEEEHLLPFSRSFNDGRSNKVIAHTACNRKKGNKSPYEAFGHLPEWEDILARVNNLPKNKRWRFQPDAWEKMGDEDGVIARMLNDTRYMTKITKAYLSAIYENEKGKSKVWAIPGQMTSLLRDKWGLNNLLGDEDNKKDRTDHRHHAIDALVVGCTDRGSLKKLSDAAKKLELDEKLWEKRKKLVTEFDEPFDGFRQQLEHHLNKMVISYKPDHGDARKAIHAQKPFTVGSLHQETAYGVIGQGKKKGTLLVTTRKPITSFEKIKNIEEIGDETIKQKLLIKLSGIKEGSAEWKQTIEAFSQETGIRRLRVHLEKTEDVLVPIKQPKDRGPEKTKGKPYKYYQMGGNYCAEIYFTDEGKKAGEWQCEIISNYHAHQKDFIPNWKKENPTAKLIMRLQINDMIAYEENGETKITRVTKMTGGSVFLIPHTYTKKDYKKGFYWCAYPNGLKQKNARKIAVDVLGRVKAPVLMKQKSKAA